jgi:hypothetical protein
MSELRIWVFPSKQAGLVDFESGHLEMEVRGTFYSLLPDEEADPITPVTEETLERYVITPGFISKLAPTDFGRKHDILRVWFASESPPLYAAVFSKTISSAEESACEDLLLKIKDGSPPNYCPASLPGTHNCVTFAVWVMKQVGIWKSEFELSKWYLIPDVFLRDSKKLLKAGFFTTLEYRQFLRGRWVAKH